MKKRRWTCIDILKCLAAIAVVEIHKPLEIQGGDEFLILCRFAVPVFFMITGFFYPETVAKKRELKQLGKIFTITIGANLFYLLWEILLAVEKRENIKEALLARFEERVPEDFILWNFSPLSPHLWYLQALLYVLVIAFIVEHLGLRKLAYLAIPVLLAGSLIKGSYSLFFVGKYPNIIPVLFLTLGFGIIGFLDDYLKVVLRRSDGLLPKQKMLGQIIVTTIFLVYILVKDDSLLGMLIPFSGGKYWECKFITIPLVYFVVIGTVNGVNFTDGLDGLATGVTTMVAVFFTVVSIAFKGGIEPVTAAVTGALLGFLLFNVHPAQVFMGDTGSLALGGFVAGCAYMLKMPWIIVIVGMIYLIEVLSVMIQVTYFKKTGGKRFFKMAPIHHHFELCGWSETRVVAVFTVVTALLCVAGLMILS